MKNAAPTTTNSRRAAWIVGIIVLSACAGMLADWSAPGIDRYVRDRLMRARGRMPAPDDIAIVAIDEPSIGRLGRFPWPRSVMARAIDLLAAAQPRVIALDVLYTDPTTPEEDDALVRAVAHAGNVVVAAELVDSPVPGGPSTWLLPLPELQRAAAAVGHVNVLAESEGVGRGLLIRAADDSGHSFLAMAVETVRIADRTPLQAVMDTPDAVLVGQRAIPVETAPPSVIISQANAASVQTLRAARMSIDYIGPTGSYAPFTYSFADVLEGHVPAARFRGKNVLIGATAASMGDRLASPFVHAADPRADLHGTLMPGVEVLANSVNTIVRSRFYTETPDWLAFLVAALVAAVTLALLAAAQGPHEFPKQVVVLGGMGTAIVVCGAVAFDCFLVFPPLVPGLVSFAAAGLLGLVRRSMAISAQLDENIARLANSDDDFSPRSDAAAIAESIAHFISADAVAIFRSFGSGEDRLLASYGAPAIQRSKHDQPPSDVFQFSPSERDKHQVFRVLLEDGVLMIAHAFGHPPSHEDQRLCAAIASACIQSNRAQPGETRPLSGWIQGGESKALTLGLLNQRLMERSRYIHQALCSVDDGLVIASVDGRIAFANPRAAELLRSTPEMLVGMSLLQRLGSIEEVARNGDERISEHGVLQHLLVERDGIEREFSVRGSPPRRFTLRIAPVSAERNASGQVIGIVASLSDVTRHHELQQIKNDVVALVSHEMRTPLTAIQGMSELIASYDMEPVRLKEMSGAINSEAKRLTRMITDYLDIARLESGATALRPTPLRVETLVERTLLLLDPIASGRGIQLIRHFGDIDPILADLDLLSRAVSNLVSNAIKYSPAGTQVVVSTREDPSGAIVEVADHGYGIPSSDLEHIFEKFYRVPRVEDADTPGTGLGLALVREIAELHGGTVRVASQPGAGSTFKLSIPRSEQVK